MSRIMDSEPQREAELNAHDEKYHSETCRICLETVSPTMLADSQVIYQSPEPELGRLLRPCQCRGSSSYVHEGCLRLWRIEAKEEKRYWRCPTCGYHYQLQQPRLASWMTKSGVEIILSIIWALLSIIFLGLVADPFINLSINPVEALYYNRLLESNILRTGLMNGYTFPNCTRPMGPWSELLTRGIGVLSVLSLCMLPRIAMGRFGLIMTLLSLRCHFERSTAPQKHCVTVGNPRIAYISWWAVLFGLVKFVRVCFLFRCGMWHR